MDKIETPKEEAAEDLKAQWEVMDGRKGETVTRCETYAMWTVPWVCPQDNEDGKTQSKGNVAIGSRLVNHLANRIVDVMFPTDTPFFTLPLSPAADRRLRSELPDENAYAKKLLEFKKATLSVEQDAMRDLNMTAYRPQAVMAVINAIVAGNAIIHRQPDRKRVVYGIKDFCVTRNLKGDLTSVLLRDSKRFEDLGEDEQRLVEEAKGRQKQDASVDIFTYYYLEHKTWHRVQSVDEVVIESTRESYSLEEFPCVDITWDLSRGETYARGLVEANSILFHNVNEVSAVILDIVGILSNIKFFVDPASSVDINELNNSDRGTYHLGREGDVTKPDFKHVTELEAMRTLVAEWERQLSQAFLLNAGTIRDAERVTAEEIRVLARELESAFGGIYSKLALNWQQREADFLVAGIEKRVPDLDLDLHDVIVSTGMESLSREGQLDALRLAIGDLQMLDAVPEDVRATIDKQAFSQFVFTNRGVNLAQFVLSKEQIQANQDAEMKQQQALMQSQGQVDVAKAAATSQGE
ncbi:hypothetical protein HOR19_gp37 [Phage MedPE-SWcel-C56]|uniref:Head-tail connector protein n=1 Tax=Phage MedPE-SWcel-C56 TaxID=1871314 RepID=A0A1B1IY23_9CAUD|nr:hypothetical protein HOR19_gp37 [Phage MedPE-SWcel-C56]ANS06230.1 hypothetical protein [Phage MedPE-SWcel-C56]